MSYVSAPFFADKAPGLTSIHAREIKAKQLALALNNVGYIVDIVDYRDYQFVALEQYQILIGMTYNFTRLSRVMARSTLKIYFATRSEATFEINALRARHFAASARRGTMFPDPPLNFQELDCCDPNDCDAIFLIGNAVTARTFSHYGRPVYVLPNIPIVNCVGDDALQEKDYGFARSNFLYLASSPALLKGLDVALEVFAKERGQSLFVCAPMPDPGFLEAYGNELFNHPNIHYCGFVDVHSQAFDDLCRRCAFVISLSCAEGMSGAILTAMCRGLIPVATPETGIDLDDCALRLGLPHVEQVREQLSQLSTMAPKRLQKYALASARMCRNQHSVDNFRKSVDNAMQATLWMPVG